VAFYNSINDTNNFAISFSTNPQQDFGVFAVGYRQAAAILAERLLAKQRFSDYEAYPVVFLYRQSLELYLKGLLYKAAILSAFKQIEPQADLGFDLTQEYEMALTLYGQQPAEK